MLAQAEAQLRATTTALKAANNGMEGFASSTDKASSKSLAGAIAQGTVMAGIFSKLYSAALSAAKGFIQSGIEYNAQIEKYTTGFTNMLGSAEAAQQVMSQIQEDAAKTPFDVASLTQANQYLISAGENASYARNTIMALGDAVSATGGGNDELNRMAQNLQQIANTGKATAVDIKQFAYAGINVYGILADYTGKSTAEVQKMTISYDLLTQALQAASEEGGRYYNSMDTQSQTMNGRVSTLKDNVSQLAGLLTGDLSGGIGVVIGNLNDLIVKAQEAYKTDGWIGLAGAITGLTDPINTAKNAFKDFASKATTWLDQLSYKLNRFLGKAATANFDTYEEYADANNRQSNRNRLRQNALNGVGISNKSWSERQAELAAAAGTGGSSITTSPTGSSGRKKSRSKSTTETVIASVSNTVTTSAMNALGAVTTSVETLQEKVKDSAGKIKDRITETTTTTGKEMVNGVATTFKQVETKVNGTVTKVTKTYDDMSKKLLGTSTNVSETTFNGITTKVQQAVEKYADGSEHIKKTVTETGQRIGENGAETYQKIITYVDGIEDKVNETSTAIDKSVKGTQSRIDGYLSGASGQMNKGVFGLFKSFISDAKNGDWGNLGLDFVNLIWGEVSQGQRETISKWANDALEAINEAYSGGGLSKAFETLKQLFGDGIVASADGASTDVKAFGEVFKALTGEVKSNGSQIIGVLTKIGTSMGGLVTSTGEGIAGLASSLGGLGGVAEGLGGVFTQIGSLIMSNPEVAAIIAIVAGVVALGAALWAIFGRKKNEKKESPSKLPYKDLQDAYWYGNERAFAGYDYRTDPFMFNPNNSAVIGYQTKMQEQLAKLTDVVQQYLPDVANQQIVLDDGTLVGKIAPGMDAQLGQLAVLAERGN
nr:MAG TPA: tail tape measure protein [Caudoviricetes sp.]